MHNKIPHIINNTLKMLQNAQKIGLSSVAADYIHSTNSNKMIWHPHEVVKLWTQFHWVTPNAD